MKLTRELQAMLSERKIVESLLTGKTLRAIERDLGVGYRRLKRIETQAAAAGYLDGSKPLPPYPECLFELKSYIASSEVDQIVGLHHSSSKSDSPPVGIR